MALDVSTDYLVGVTRQKPIIFPPLANPDVPRSQEELADWPSLDEEQRLADNEGSRQNTLLPIFRRQKYISFRPAGAIEAPIPVYGEAVGELIVIAAFAEGTVARPPLLRWNDGAYAVIADGSMSPRYNSGEILYVAPGIAVRDGDYVVVVTRSDGLFGRVCRLKDVTNTHVLVETLSPQRTQTIALDAVAHIHRIVLAGQKSLD
ncbi:MAG: S24 family peptidase [Pseudolabrys sp.]|nr:S24 family peptidase [Pseudolabrys sp.]MDP2295387.1 S24 family peptidase [Pseudolabrys sp.]